MFYLGGGPYNEQVYEEALKAITESRLDVFLEKLKYNVKEDNLELYLIKYNLQKAHIVIVYDPFELYQREEVLNIIPFKNYSSLEMNAEQIYP